MKKYYKFLNLCSLSTASFLVIWPSQYKFLINEFVIKRCVFRRVFLINSQSRKPIEKVGLNFWQLLLLVFNEFCVGLRMNEK